MNKLNDCYMLNNGVEIPCLGFGTWQTPDGDLAVSSVKNAIEVGYRHIDTAAVYENERSVGKAIKESEIDRRDLFIVSKLWNTIRGFDNTLFAFDETLKKLNLEYLDLYLIHWPNPLPFRDSWQEKNAETWRAMEKLYHEGRIRSIGISNFMPHHIDALLKTAEIVPMVNQIRLCPGETQEDTVRYCKDKDILIEAYSPLGTGKVFDVPEMKDIATKYDKTIAQVCIRWSLQNGFLPLPKSVTPSRIKENTDVFDFEIDKEDMQRIANLEGCCGKSFDPDKVKW